MDSVRQAAHRHLDAWLDQMGELFELPESPTPCKAPCSCNGPISID